MNQLKGDIIGDEEDGELLDVRAFHQKFAMIDTAGPPQHLTKRKLAERVNFMLEELAEFAEAAGLSVHGPIPWRVLPGPGEQDIALQTDALVDIVYVVKGTAAMMGLPWKPLWNDVQRANMAKVRGLTHRGNASDVTKPPGWQGPKTLTILRAAGYDPSNWLIADGRGGLTNDAEKCVDDPTEAAPSLPAREFP